MSRLSATKLQPEEQVSPGPILVPTSSDPVLGRRERGKLERRRRIQQAARDVFAEKGYAVATTREIAERADVGKGTLFTYARDKRELLLLIVNEELDALTETSFATLPKKASLLTRLMHIFTPRYEFWGRDPALSRHVVHEVFSPLIKPSEDDINEHVSETARFHAREPRIIARFAEIVGALQRTGTITNSEEPQLIAQLLWDIYLSENRNWLATTEPNVSAGLEHLKRVLTVAINGLKV